MSEKYYWQEMDEKEEREINLIAMWKNKGIPIKEAIQKAMTLSQRNPANEQKFLKQICEAYKVTPEQIQEHLKPKKEPKLRQGKLFHRK
ncbi:MAG: hypothetical protein JW703_03815 [Candidatus Diapherotrites archaeon]|nr:hypothetical protein [Candidatus Diapherotrites archaeon]